MIINTEIENLLKLLYKNKYPNKTLFNKRNVYRYLHYIIFKDKPYIKQYLELYLAQCPEWEAVQNIVWGILNNVRELPVCPTCGKQMTFSQKDNGACSKKCINQDELVNKRKNTMKERYGVEFTTQSPELLQKMYDNNMKKYGVEHVLQNKNIKQKQEQTCLEKYGSENVGSLKLFRDKAKETMKLKYGNENIFQIELFKNKKEQTLLKRYGVTVPNRNEELLKKQIRTRKTKYYNNVLLSESFPVIPLFSLEEYLDKDVHNYLLCKWKCKQCGNVFEDDYKTVPRCLTCHPYIKDGYSNSEKLLFLFIKSIYKGEIILNDKNIIAPKELDIVLPLLKIAIEFNGDYWHSSQYERITSDYHKIKTELCSEKGYKLIHIFEHEWVDKQDIIKAKLKSIICNDIESVYARKCLIKLIKAKESNLFLNNNHIQGEDHSSIRIGLYYLNKLVALMTFCKPRFNKKYDYELSRYATSKRVIGGASKLLKYFRDHYTGSIITYCDRRFSTGNMYLKIGFKLDHISEPNYWWYLNGKVLTRYECQKHKLKEILGNKFNLKLSEKLNMLVNGYSKVFDCGNLVYIM